MKLVLVFVEPGKERRIATDLEDFIFPYDMSVKARPSGFSSIILLETSLPKRHIIELIKKSNIGFIRRILYFDYYTTLDKWKEIVKYIKDKVKTKEINIKIKGRGMSNKSKEILSLIQRKLSESNFKFSNNGYPIRIETLGEIIGIVLGDT